MSLSWQKNVSFQQLRKTRANLTGLSEDTHPMVHGML